MATFTSTQNGVWRDGATWGNASPGAAGVDFPGVDNDVANIGHEVDYDAGATAVVWGNITITSGGVLIIPIDANSDILLNATAVLLVNSGGELRAGTLGAPIDKAYTFNFHPPQGASARVVFQFPDGAIINVYGDPDFYGSDPKTELAVDWSSGQTFTVVGDYTTKWQSGQRVVVHANNVGYPSANTWKLRSPNFTIDSLALNGSNTDITINEANPGFSCYAGGKVMNISRNIEFADPGSPTTLYGYNGYNNYIRSYFDQYYYYPPGTLNFHDVVFRGWERAFGGAGNGSLLITNNVVFHNCNSAVYLCYDCSIGADFYSNEYGINGLDYGSVTGDFFGNENCIVDGEDLLVTGDMVENGLGIDTSRGLHIVGDGYRNYALVDPSDAITFEGEYYQNNTVCNRLKEGKIVGDVHDNNFAFSWCGDIVVIGDIYNNVFALSWCKKALVKGGDLTNNTSTVGVAFNGRFGAVLEDCTLEGIDRQPLRIYGGGGDFLPLVSGDGDWQTPPSGSSWILQATPNTYQLGTEINQMELSPRGEMSDYVSAGSRTLTFKIYPVGWAALDQDDILIVARYLDSVSGITRTTVVTAAGSFANGDWRDLTVDFAPGQAGIVYFQLFIKKYEAAAYVLIDPEWIVV